MAEMAEPAMGWPERSRAALESLHALGREYDQLGGPIERLAQEAGRMNVRVPNNPLQVAELDRMRQVKLHPPVPRGVQGGFTIDQPPEGLEELAPRASARLVP